MKARKIGNKENLTSAIQTDAAVYETLHGRQPEIRLTLFRPYEGRHMVLVALGQAYAPVELKAYFIARGGDFQAQVKEAVKQLRLMVIGEMDFMEQSQTIPCVPLAAPEPSANGNV